MLKRLNKRYNIIRYYFLFILYLNALLFTFIICEDSTCTSCKSYDDNDFNFDNIVSYYKEENCKLNCRFSVRHKKWFYCFGIDSSSKKYYYIDGNNDCQLADTCQLTISSDGYNADKVVLPTNECIQSCSSIDNNIIEKFYELGDFCLYNSYINKLKYKIIPIKGIIKK